MPRRIVVLCDAHSAGPAGRHRWAWRVAGFDDDDVPYWDRRCERCGRWYIDVLGEASRG